MRSFSSRRASDTNRSGGIHGMSRWQSAEILRYCMLFSPLQGCRRVLRALYSFEASDSWERRLPDPLFCARDMNVMQPAACIRTQSMLCITFNKTKDVTNAFYH